jgi:hypothetical protein
MMRRHNKQQNQVHPFVPTAVLIVVLLGLLMLMSETGLLDLTAQQRPF